MTIKEIIDGLKFTVDMFLFDPGTGETFTEPRNDMDQTTIDACKGAIELLEQEPCKDCVSRQAVINKIFNASDNNCDVVLSSELMDRIKALPPVTPQTRWIPVSERLPEESLNSVIGWDAHRERCVFVQYIDGYFQITGSDESFNIVAWRPLPEPYKVESEDKE